MEILTQRFQNHWYPNNPSKGQGYRCIRINQNCRVDYSIEMACQHAGISYDALRLPVELTLWIDPSEVTCR
ncbi:B-cell translocation protein-like protein [Euroglyphus maynei]|uniref:B-cell translocation protein-like protein n=1 Tax=Euroglyphus maynei TaxID=6958 RepID=A0A1Y3B347_EURMA|nr:B-cell translocation protein-like protein [Euroglyphus maynei]